MYYPKPNTIDMILSITDRDRTSRITKILSKITRPHRVQHADPDILNIIIPAKKQKGKIVLTAHHDLYPGSIGYNDNSTGVVSLLRLQDVLPDDVEVVFTDREESGGRGCQAYLEAEQRKGTLPRIAINVDVVGLGEKVFGVAYGAWKSIKLDGTAIEFLDSIPFTDSDILARYGVPNIILITGTRRKNLVDEIWSAQHNNSNDGKLELISEKALENVHGTLKALIGGNSNG